MNKPRLIRLQDEWMLAAVAGALILLAAWNAEAATYNFYFNNAEQGDNSTAAPSVVVHDKGEGQAPVVQKVPDPQPSAVPSGQAAGITPEPASPSPTSSNESVVPAYLPQPSDLMSKINRRWFRLQGGYSAVGTVQPKNDSYTTYSYSSDYGYSTYSSSGSSHGRGGYELSATLLPSKYVGLTAFYGPVLGLEVEMIPIHSWEGKVEMGFMLGVSQVNSEGGAVGHGGARLSWNTNYPWGVTLAARLAPTSSNNGYLALEGGLTYSF